MAIEILPETTETTPSDAPAEALPEPAAPQRSIKELLQRPEEFRGWLMRCGNSQVGVTCRSAVCPLASWLSARGHGRVSVQATTVYDHETVRQMPLPRWVQAFVLGVDHHFDQQPVDSCQWPYIPISGTVALQVLEQVLLQEQA
jgi:hypothetical protein